MGGGGGNAQAGGGGGAIAVLGRGKRTSDTAAITSSPSVHLRMHEKGRAGGERATSTTLLPSPLFLQEWDPFWHAMPGDN